MLKNVQKVLMNYKSASENEHKNKCSSFTLYIVLFSMIFTISMGIAIYFVYYKYMSRNEKMFLNMIMSIKKQIINVSINGKSQKNKH